MNESESRLERYRALKRGALRSQKLGGTVAEKLLAIAAHAEGFPFAKTELNAATVLVSSSPNQDDLDLVSKMEHLETDLKLRSYWHWCSTLLSHKLNPLAQPEPALYANNPVTDFCCTELMATEIEQQMRARSTQELKLQAIECRARAKNAKTALLARFWSEMQVRTETFVAYQILQNLAETWSLHPANAPQSVFKEYMRNRISENELEFSKHREIGSGKDEMPEYVAVAIKSDKSTFYIDPQRQQFNEPWLSPAVCGYRFALFYPDLADDEKPSYELHKSSPLWELSFTAPKYRTVVFEIPAEEWSTGRFDAPKTVVKYNLGCLTLEFTFQRFTRS